MSEAAKKLVSEAFEENGITSSSPTFATAVRLVDFVLEKIRGDGMDPEEMYESLVLSGGKYGPDQKMEITRNEFGRYEIRTPGGEVAEVSGAVFNAIRDWKEEE